MDAVSETLLFLGLFSGIELFLYGMSVMGDGLKKVAGNKLETLLYGLTSTPLKGILLGAGVTAIIQSSSATSVMVVGFVNSGMMKVVQNAADYSNISPSVDIVYTCQGMNLPLALRAFFAAFSMPPQQGTSMRTIVTLLILLLAIICVSFSV